MTELAPEVGGSAADEGTTLTTDAFAAWQWEALAAADDDAPAWPLRAVGYRHWTRELWIGECGTEGQSSLLTPRQSGALWRRVVDESADTEGLIGSAGMARWAEDAWRREWDWRLDAQLPPMRGHEHDYAAYLRWRRSYSQRLRDAGWIDEAQLDVRLARAAAELRPRRIELADLADIAPSQQALFASLADAGWSIERRRSPSIAGARVARCGCEEPQDELRRAARWALDIARRHPRARVALVVPDLDARAFEVHRTIRAEFDAARGAASGDGVVPLYVAARGSDGTGEAQPLLGAARNALETLSPRGSLLDFSRWLRSPFFHGDDPHEPAVLARLEAELRGGMLAQLPFVDAYRRGGLREHVRTAAPETAARIDAAVHELDAAPERQTPAAWTRLWLRLLASLGWRGWDSPTGHVSEVVQRRHWEAALRDFAQLSPIVGSMASGRALAELDASLRRTSPRMPVPLVGVHVIGDIADIGPGYAGAWITGATDAALPRPTRLNPLLPRYLQVERGMPWSSPQDALRRSRGLIEETARRVPICVFSWPARTGEQVNEPSPLLRDMPDLVHDDVAAATPARRAATPASAWEELRDPAPPLAAVELSGGTGALNAQSICPLRAFCEHRLGARPIEPFARGVPARLQGIATHAALERFYRTFRSRRELAGASAGRLRLEAAACAEAALARLFGAARPALDRLFALERQRVEELIVELAAKELERPDFRVESVERRQSLQLAGRTVSMRIDRVDAFEDGTFAIIDYKTGRNVQVSAWAWQRPRDLQLPAYALALGDTAALVVANVRSGEVRYSGVWPARAFPGRSRLPGDAPGIERLVEAWRKTIGGLIEEFCAGDTRVFVADPEPAAGAYAPLTRIYEQLDRHRDASAGSRAQATGADGVRGGDA